MKMMEKLMPLSVAISTTRLSSPSTRRTGKKPSPISMNQCGLAIPAAEGATLSYFKHIFVDIGDSQSLSDNLSTFSGHMANIADILSSVGGRDLVLLDEVGTGTSPKEGEAIAFAVITYLIKKHADARRGPPFRHHLPQEGTLKGDEPFALR